MRSLATLLALAFTLVPTGILGAQAHAHDHTSPYASFTHREIKALSPEETEGLLNGGGLGMALSAELNHYPGPRHVLEMRALLDLSSEQEAEIQRIFDEMQEQARPLGRTIVDLERGLDRSFADGSITEGRMVELLEAIALAQARLRAAHLRAHLRLVPILTESQRERYERARGYAG